MIWESQVFWTGVALLLLVALVWWRGRESVRRALRSRIDGITREVSRTRRELEESARELAMLVERGQELDHDIATRLARVEEEIEGWKERTRARVHERRQRAVKQMRIQQELEIALAGHRLREALADRLAQLMTGWCASLSADETRELDRVAFGEIGRFAALEGRGGTAGGESVRG